MKKLLLLIISLFMACGALSATEGVSLLRVLYIGQRAGEFVPFLKAHFTTVESVARDQFKPKQADAFDVVLLDWPQSGTMRGAWLDGSPLGKREDWHKPTVLLGSAGLNLAVVWKLDGGSGCTCLAPVAYNLRPHPIFNGPMLVDIHATTNIPTPTQFKHELKTNDTIAVLPLVDGIRNYHTVINDYARGWSTHYYEFANMPDVEVFSGGINEQTPRSAAFWREGNLLHFGFEQSPTQLNAVGRAMLVDAIVYISHFTGNQPIDIVPSVFGPERIAVSRDRARGYFARWPRELTNVFSAAALKTFDWHNATNAQAWFDAERPWIHPNADNYLEVDTNAKSLNVVFDSPDFFPKAIAALRNDESKTAAADVLSRYAPQGPGNDADADAWEKWWQTNKPYLFYSELGEYRWYIDPLAKKRGVPSKDLRGPARADKPFLSAESMTPERFEEIIDKPADSIPLVQQLADIPFWPNVVVSNVMTYASGKVFREGMEGTARTVGGKYIVFALQSKFYDQLMHAIVAYDAQASAIKTYGLYGDGHGGNRVTEATIIYNFANKTYTISSAYGDFKETGTGFYTDTEDVCKTLVYKEGNLFLTREVTTRPAIK